VLRCLQITCRNGDIVRTVFVIDAHDREALAWHAATGTGIAGSMVRDLMLDAVELRSGTVQAAHAAKWPSDNCSLSLLERHSTSRPPSA
jgi:putative transposase